MSNFGEMAFCSPPRDINEARALDIQDKLLDDYNACYTSDTDTVTNTEDEALCGFDSLNGAYFKTQDAAKEMKAVTDKMKLEHYRQMQYLSRLEKSLNASVAKLDELYKGYPFADFYKNLRRK